MTDLDKAQSRLEELRRDAADYFTAKRRINSQLRDLEVEIKKVDVELSKLALADAMDDLGAQDRFLERFRHQQDVVNLFQYRKEYNSLLVRLHEKYDEYLEQDLVRIASYASISSENRNADVYKYHIKHDIPTNKYDPLRLEPPRPGMQI